MVSRVARRSRFPLSIELRSVLILVTVGILSFTVLLPIVLLAINSFTTTRPFEPTEYGLDAWRYALSDHGMLVSIWNTIRLAVTHQVISFPIAILISWLIARTNIPGGKWLEFFFWMAFFIPLIPAVQGWILLLDPNYGVINQLIERLPFVDQGPFNIFSFWGMAWMHLVTSTIAIKVMLFTPAFRNLDATLEEASTVAGSSVFGTLRHVTIPVLTPTIVTVMVLALIRAFQSVEIELVLGLPVNFFVFGSKIFDLTRSEPPNYGAATAMGTYVMVAMVPLILYHRYMTSPRRRFTTITSAYKPQLLNLRRWRWPAFTFVIILGLTMTVVPFVSLLVGTFMKLYGFFDVPTGAWTLDHWRAVLNNAQFVSALRNTLILAVGGSFLMVGVFSVVAYVLVRWRFKLRGFADTLTWIPTMLPGILIALAWFWIFLRIPFLRPLYGTMWALILVSGLSGMTLAVQLMKSNILQLGAELEESSEIAGASLFTTMRKIVFPLLMPTMVVLFVFHFVLAAGNAIMPSYIASPDSKPLALMQLEFILAGDSERSSAAGIFIVFISAGMAIVARMFGFRVGLGRAAV